MLNGDLDNPDAEDLEENGGQVPTWRLQEWTRQVKFGGGGVSHLNYP